jgi:hypothetical protein
MNSAQEETLVEVGCFSRAHTSRNLDPGRSQRRDATARHSRVGVLDRHNRASHACMEKGIDAGRRFTVVCARLKGDDDRPLSGEFPGLSKRLRLGVGSTTRLRPAAPYRHPIAKQDAPHRRVGPSLTKHAHRQIERRPHERLIILTQLAPVLTDH